MAHVVFLGRVQPPRAAIDRHLEAVRAELATARAADPAGLLEACAQADGVILHGQAPFTAEVLAALPRCRVIARCGAGVDGIDLDAATRLGVVVCNAPGRNAPDVADQTLGLILAVTRRFFRTWDMVRSGRWSREHVRGAGHRGPVHRLAGRTLGILGLGHVGRAVARRAVGFGLTVIAHDPYVPESAGVIPGVLGTAVALVPRDELFRRSDVLSLHASLTAETRGSVGARELALLPPGAILINTARGGIVDHEALVEALRSGRLAGAGLDVTLPEPLLEDSPLLTLENVIVTAHTAGNTEESFVDVCAHAAYCVAEVLQGRLPEGAVNPEALAARSGGADGLG